MYTNTYPDTGGFLFRKMYWADKLALDLKNRGPQRVDDAKTPSGIIHVGSIRGVIIHDLAFKALVFAGVKTRFTYIFDSIDAFDRLPIYLDPKIYEPFLGVPLYKMPSPENTAQDYAAYYALKFQKVFNALGANPEILWSHELYLQGVFNKQIILSLENAEKIQDLYQEISGSKKREQNWLPFQPICERCGKIGTTIAQNWDGQKVAYTCSPNLVTWAKGCGYSGKVSPLNGTGKLPWKVEWPAKWAALGVTVEGEGKDHSSAGGSRDIADHISKEIFHYSPPKDIPYEFFLFGGRKISTSKAVGATAEEVASIVPPEILRFIMARIRPNQSFDFDPMGDTIPIIFDNYDRASRAYFENGKDDLARIFELSQIEPIKKTEKYFVPRFSLVAQWVQMPNIDPTKETAKLKGAKLTDKEKEMLEERVKYALLWLEKFASEESRFAVTKETPSSVGNLSREQKSLLKTISENLNQSGKPEEFQNQIYTWGKELGLSSNQTFEAIYLSLLGKKSGPKASWLILSLDKEFVKKRFKSIS